MMVVADANGYLKGTELVGYPFYLIFEDYEDNKVRRDGKKQEEKVREGQMELLST